MVAMDSYERLYQDILHRYRDHSEGEWVTFGILLADARQSDAREYILNYLDVFHRRSGRYFHFYISGLCRDNGQGLSFLRFTHRFRIGNQYYGFDEEMFERFCERLYEDFDIYYTFNPMLILTTMQKGDRRSARHLIIELDQNENHSVRRSGELFMDIFEAAVKNPELADIQSALRKNYIKGNALGAILRSVGPKWLEEVGKASDEMSRFRIKG